MNKYLILVGSILFSGCLGNDGEVDNPKNPDNEEEVITTLTLKFINQNSTEDTISVTYFDPDGDGGNGPLAFDSIALDNGTYNVEMEILDESNSNEIINIGEEIEEEADEHQFFFQTDIPGFTIEYDDQDINGNPLGLKTIWRITKAGNGDVIVILKHQPDQKPSAPGNINIGATDIELSFPTIVR
ncbi:MAG: hypothetical protein ACJATA_001935 [Sphingobacteriales bacterium]|jgi:hypothetical protein